MTRYVAAIWLMMFMEKWVECKYFQCGFREFSYITDLHLNFIEITCARNIEHLIGVTNLLF